MSKTEQGHRAARRQKRAALLHEVAPLVQKVVVRLLDVEAGVRRVEAVAVPLEARWVEHALVEADAREGMAVPAVFGGVAQHALELVGLRAVVAASLEALAVLRDAEHDPTAARVREGRDGLEHRLGQRVLRGLELGAVPFAAAEQHVECGGHHGSAPGDRRRAAQSARVRGGVITGTGPTQQRSCAATSPKCSTRPSGTTRRCLAHEAGSVRWCCARCEPLCDGRRAGSNEPRDARGR